MSRKYFVYLFVWMHSLDIINCKNAGSVSDAIIKPYSGNLFV